MLHIQPKWFTLLYKSCKNTTRLSTKLPLNSVVQLGSNETLRICANAVLTHTRMRAHTIAFASKRKRVGTRRGALLAKKNRSQTHFARICALPIQRTGLF